MASMIQRTIEIKLHAADHREGMKSLLRSLPQTGIRVLIAGHNHLQYNIIGMKVMTHHFCTSM